MITLMRGASLAETTAFVTVVELKSFAKAAKQLALSPPRVSEMCTGRSRSRRRSPAAKLSRAAPGQIAFGFLEIIADRRIAIAHRGPRDVVILSAKASRGQR